MIEQAKRQRGDDVPATMRHALLLLLLLLAQPFVAAEEIATGSTGVDVLDLLGVTDQATRTRIAGQAEADQRDAAARQSRQGEWGAAAAAGPETAAHLPMAAAGGFQARASAPPAAPLASSIEAPLREVLRVLPGGMPAGALGSRVAATCALANAQVPAVADKVAALAPALPNDEALVQALLILIPAAVSASEIHVAYEALRILDMRVTDRPGAPPAYRAQIAEMFTEVRFPLSFVFSDCLRRSCR